MLSLTQKKVLFPKERRLYEIPVRSCIREIVPTVRFMYLPKMFQVAGALIPLAQAMYANRDIGPARQACTRAMKILQRVFGDRPSIEVRIKDGNILSSVQQKLASSIAFVPMSREPVFCRIGRQGYS